MTERIPLRVLLTVAVMGHAAPGAGHEPADARALDAIFGDDYLAENVRHICSRAETLSPEDRFTFLSDWVLPGNRRRTFRLDVDFTSTYPAPAVAGSGMTVGFRVPSGGEVVSPALGLVDAAASLGRLDELRQRVDAAESGDVRGQIDRLALLALIDMAGDDLPSAQALLAEQFALVLSEENADLSRIDALLLCVHEAANHPTLCQPIVDPAYRFTRTYQTVVDRTAWQRQFTAAYARVKYVAERADDGVAGAEVPISFTRWFPVSLPRARNRGAGAPVAQWHMAPGFVENLSSHDEDYVYYAVPLRGDFAVECDVGMFGWNESEIFLGCKWLRAVHDHESFKVGGLGGMESNNRIPPLTKGKESIHYRSVARDGALTTYLHGRRVYEQPLPGEYDPWLAIHSALRHDGPVSNLRLTGNPVIPDELRLSSDADLGGWIPYFDDAVGIDWRYANREIHAPRQQDLPSGCYRESALFYHRPMLEDGGIEYEFWYEHGAWDAHPVLDRLCFLVRPAGVSVHWLTDGRYDRSPLAPDNLTDERRNRRGPDPPPLREGDWNHLRLTTRGDSVDLFLNGDLVYQRQVEPTNQRHFGLFHYGDQTQLRVRNVTWTGDWPREIPEINSQELAVDETEFLDERLPGLTAVFTHDFTDGLRLDQFSFLEGTIPAEFTVARDGLHARRPGTGGYNNATIAPSLIIRGDFDITAAFDQLVTEPSGTGSSNIFLQAVADTADECLLLRRRSLHRGRDQQLVQCSRVVREGAETRRSFFAHQPMEAPAGTLRLARRGETAYYLFAEHDSPNFRIIGQESFPAADVPLHGLRLKLQTHGDGGVTRVVWKSLAVRAEELLGPAVNDEARLLLNLNREQ